MNKKFAVAAALSALMAAPLVNAEEKHPSRVYRESYFHLLGLHFQPLRMMVQRQIPWDADRAAVLGRDLKAVSQIDILSQFPEGSEGGEAKLEIWDDFDDFSERMNTMRTEAAKMAEATASGDQDAVGKQLGALGKSCKSCHDVYREEE